MGEFGAWRFHLPALVVERHISNFLYDVNQNDMKNTSLYIKFCGALGTLWSLTTRLGA